MRHIFQIFFSLLLFGCGAEKEVLNRPINEMNWYAPEVIKGGREADYQKYRVDREECLKHVQSSPKWATSEAVAIVEVRKCLIGRGYILVS